jgi:hypothetical protein
MSGAIYSPSESSISRQSGEPFAIERICLGKIEEVDGPVGAGDVEYSFGVFDICLGSLEIFRSGSAPILYD